MATIYIANLPEAHIILVVREISKDFKPQSYI